MFEKGVKNPFQKPPTETSSGNFRSILQAYASKRPEMAGKLEKFLSEHDNLFHKIEAARTSGKVNEEIILNEIWRLTDQQGLPMEQALGKLEEFIDAKSK